MNRLINNRIRRSRMNFPAIIFMLLFSFLNITSTYCQIESRRPKIGLALSGGGSCGIAHVGVLKVMEEAGLRPDYITGVSMGSIIGGFYSIGYSADSLEKILNNIDWKLIMSNRIPEYKIIYPEKNHFYNSMVSFPVSIKRSIIPSGLNNGQQIENILSFYAWPSALTSDFSKLPIPFMCLATNLVTCQQSDLTSGYLPDAMRASSAVPTIFTPLKINNIPLIDGGMVRNLAANEARKMGADIVIGSYTGSYLSKPDELESIPDILGQIFFFVGVFDFEDQKKYADILIEPKTDDIASTSFVNIDTIIQRGYNAALPYRETFRKLADSLDQFGKQKPMPDILGRKKYVFDKIEINGNRKISDSQILGVLGIKAGQETDKYLLRSKIDLLYGKAWFDKVKYRIIPGSDSLILNIDCVEAPKTMVYGSVHYDDALHSGLIIDLSVKNPLIQRSLIDINTFIGHYYKASVEYSQFLNRSQKYSLSAKAYAENTFIPWLELYGNTGATFNRVLRNKLSLNTRIGLNHMLSISVELENRYLIPDYISDNRLKRINHNYGSAFFEYNVNTLDNKHFPDKGINIQLLTGVSELTSARIVTDYESIVLNKGDQGITDFERFFTIYGNFSQFISRDTRLTIGINANVLFISGTDSVSSQNNFYFLGGFESINNRSVPMTGFHACQIPVRKLAGLRLNTDYEILDKLHINFNTDVFIINKGGDQSKTYLLGGIGAGIGYMSVFGPLKAGIMYGSFKNDNYFKRLKGYISLGYNF